MRLHLIWVMRAIRFAAKLVAQYWIARPVRRNRRLQMGTLESKETK